MKYLIFFLIVVSCSCFGLAQEGFVFKEGYDQEKISFEKHSNLIVIPVKINDVDFNFILDSGATKTIIFNLKGIDSLSVKKGNYIDVKGYGKENSITAYYSLGNNIKVGKNIENDFAEVLVLSESEIDLSPKIDIEVHGLLSVNFFRNFVTHIDYVESYLSVYDEYEALPRYLRKSKQFDFDVKDNRPTINIELHNDLVKGNYELLIDTGSGDALWVLNKVKKNDTFKNTFEDYLGFGFNGEIFGLRTKVKSLDLFNLTLKKVAVSYPYEEYYSLKKTHDGSLGGEVLRRFDVLIDYPNKKISLLPNKDFSDGFFFNMSGLGVQKGDLELFTFVDRTFTENDTYNSLGNTVKVSTASRISYRYVPQLYVDYVRKDSPGDKAGIKIGDQIISINNYKQKELSLAVVTELFYKNPYKNLKITLKREEQEFSVKIKNIPLVL